MYKADPRIVRMLKEYDSHLDARWNQLSHRWVITWRGKDIFELRNDDGSFRPLDERVVTHVAMIDAWKHRDGASFIRELTEHNHRLSQAQRARYGDLYQQAAKEDLYRAFFGGPQIPVGVDMTKMGAET